MREFAFLLTTRIKKLNFDFRSFELIFDSIKNKFNLQNENPSDVLSEIQTHNGLIVPYFSNRYSFLHKTIQEYLTADYILRQGFLPDEINILPNELAILLGILDNPNDKLYQICFEHREIFDHQYANTFVTRLLIEKPIFTESPLLGLSLISIYNQVKRIESIERRPSYKLYSDSAVINFVEQFESYIRLPIIKSSIQMLCKHYKPKSKHLEYKNTLIILKEDSNNPLITKYQKPKRLFINDFIYKIIYEP